MQSSNYQIDFNEQLMRIIELRHHDPHLILGLHDFKGQQVIRLWRPEAQQVYLEVKGTIVEATKVHPLGIFEYIPSSKINFSDYRVYHRNGLLAHDPYSFLPQFGELDQHLFGRGVHYQLYKVMGGRLTHHQGVEGARFVVWAPNARNVSVIGDFNHWDGRVNPMRVLGYSGVWELFIPGLTAGQKYKFEIQTQQGHKLVKADPYALMGELRPATASILVDSNQFKWQDQQWVQKRKERSIASSPMSIYEVHLGSWNKIDNHFMNYRDLAHNLCSYCQYMGFNYVELLPIQEHPLDESWGYQVTGFYSPTSRFGTPDDFKYFVDYLHRNEIGVILDWVPGHFPTDDFSFGRFDGSALYEHEDPRQGYHPHWHTHIFNFGRHEVSNFLIANALFWFEEMHVDGLRVDAVASMIYLDYGREEGEWISNTYGGKENLQSIEFLKHLNSVVHQLCPGVLMIAEESTSFTGVTQAVENGGLGFDLKWNMGWMNDTLRYFSKDPLYRSYHHNDLTFGLIYAFSERFILVFSHDEVVHGKHNLLSKMPGDMWQQFANLRLLFTYMMCQPGKKLIFMGTEFGQWDEWNCKKELDWILLNFPTHRSIQEMVKEINHFYFDHPALWSNDFQHHSFEWVDFFDTKNSVVSYFRKGSGEKLLCVHNFTPTYHSHYNLYFSSFEDVREVFNSDNERYGGSGKINSPIVIMKNHMEQKIGVSISLAPLATMIFKIS